MSNDDFHDAEWHAPLELKPLRDAAQNFWGDEDLRALHETARQTFGDIVWLEACNRALSLTQRARAGNPDAPFDWDTAFQDALRTELRRLVAVT